MARKVMTSHVEVAALAAKPRDGLFSQTHGLSKASSKIAGKTYLILTQGYTWAH